MANCKSDFTPSMREKLIIDHRVCQVWHIVPDIYQASASPARRQEQMTDNQKKMIQHKQIIVWASLEYPDMAFKQWWAASVIKMDDFPKDLESKRW